MQRSEGDGRIQLLSWERLPAKAATGVGYAAFAVSVVLGLWAGNTGITILARAVFALAICWFGAWMAGMLVVHAVRRGAIGDVSSMESDIDHEEVHTTLIENISMESVAL